MMLLTGDAVRARADELHLSCSLATRCRARAVSALRAPGLPRRALIMPTPSDGIVQTAVPRWA
jgi:hypothetical protein